MRTAFALCAALAAASSLSAQIPMTKYGQGCPQPPVFYELFTGTGTGDLSGTSILFVLTPSGQYGIAPGGGLDPNFTNNLGLTDDAIGAAQPLTNPFPVIGDSRVFTQSIDVSSNGWVGLFAGDFTSSDFTETTDEFLTQGPRIAPWWDDLNPNSGGAVYFDAGPNYDMVTWDQVPQFANSDSNTFQLKLFGNGDFEITWTGGCIDDALVGYSLGGGLPDPGSMDLSASIGLTVGGAGRPIELSGTEPRVGGANWSITVDNIPSGSPLGAVNVGLSPLNFDLTAVGSPGCLWLASAEATLPLQLGTTGSASLNLASPTNAAVVGAKIYTQALIVDPQANQLGIVTSNGGEADILPPSQGIDVTCQGANTFNSDATSGYFQVANNNTAGLSITSITFDWATSSNPNQSTMVFDCDQTGMANSFDEGNGGGCGGTYRNGSDTACGLDLANALNNLANTGTCASSVPHCEANNATTAPSYKTLTWHFTPGTFVNGLTFEVDVDTDGGAGIGGDDMAGMVVIVTLSDGTTTTGEVVATGPDLGQVSL